MRTTLTIDDDVLELANQHAKARGISLGKAMTELVRRGLRGPVALRQENGRYVVDLPPDSPEVTTEHVRRLESEGV